MFGTGATYTPWFTAAATCWVCEFVTIEASVYPLRFDVVSGVAMAASEEDSVGFEVYSVYFVAEGDHDRAVVDVVYCSSCY